ncbi:MULTISPECIES: NUDIX domain-containing protein [Paenibacillus]|uniref:NUDIX domain-containing protein n=1 Tax=Paenibacillus TaxID=44249 RepID=UPI00096D94A0|nr:NUDIX domain-containing protein [Paenibacillus odorifer]MEC0134085.1 NUDIX domain-containing protein [Paenibacillus odorifer]MEC0222629.1 NUDIX domain-containing protein [Paenibacillus odorifer]OME33210.1 ADP-ribose pyrophosphatase [Paenibacillus odorifer]OME40379.1 ADP-ribose pyrophosphatase [Paenibacillus odorifer]OME42161.1 ADP-ribose pyrophosphatase [Paenibacillus odorifer]
MDLLDKDGLIEREFLEQYRAEDYERPSVTTDMVIFTVTEEDADSYRKLPEKELRVLLIRRGAHPFLGKWALPGGFVRPNETTEQAAVRELCEETGVEDIYLEQLYTFSDIGRDPRTWVISCSYMALINSDKLELKAGDDAADAAWFKVSYRPLREQKELIEDGYIKTLEYELKLSSEEEELSAVVARTMTAKTTSTGTDYEIVSNDGLAFDHAKIIACAIDRLRGKVNYTDIALHLMPMLFTLTELQQVYEVIMDKELLKAAFRRKVADLVVETDHYTENAGHRPSRLYRRNLEG